MSLTKCICANCGSEFLRNSSQLKNRKNVFCCVSCQHIGMRKPNIIIQYNDIAEIVINSKKYGIIKTIIDIEDLDKIKSYTWCANYKSDCNSFYIVSEKLMNGKRVDIKLHRLVTNCPTGLVVDHINHNTLDNTKKNLRICTNVENQQNRQLRPNNTSGERGVSYNKLRQKWECYININNKKKNLGLFVNI